MGSSFTCKLNPCCGDMRNCDPPPQYSDRYRDEPIAPAPIAPPAVAPVAVSVKDLQWTARNADGTIHIAHVVPMEYWAWELAGYGYWSWGSLSGREVHGGLEAAKSVAQSDFNARILSSIIPATKGGGTEPPKRETQEYLLRAMGANYSAGNLWDHLDKDVVLKAADEIKALRAALSAQDTDGVVKP